MLVTCGLMRRGPLLLLARRADTGLWELPGGKVEPGEDLAACLARELAEELGCTVEVGEVLARDREEPGLDLVCLACRPTEGEPRALEHRELAWLTPDQALNRRLAPADRRILSAMKPGKTNPIGDKG